MICAWDLSGWVPGAQMFRGTHGSVPGDGSCAPTGGALITGDEPTGFQERRF